jgi:hypothetical protein
MGTGTTIQVFLPDGNPRSLKIAEITSRTVQAILIEIAMDGRGKMGEEKSCRITIARRYRRIEGHPRYRYSI